MDKGTMPEYRYSRLSHNKNIRLLRLLSNKENQEELRCELFEYSLGISDKATRPYEALSYCWGSEENLKSILVDNSSFKITQNLYYALSTLQDDSISRIIWIDAICINQTSDEEKSEQIQYMPEIYAKASRVIVWLGEAHGEGNGQYDKETQGNEERDGSVEQAIEAIRLVGEDPTKLSDMKQFTPAILKLLQRNWFRRIWVR
jgi:Heterokaryon incompatibility protein (HET)